MERNLDWNCLLFGVKNVSELTGVPKYLRENPPLQHHVILSVKWLVNGIFGPIQQNS